MARHYPRVNASTRHPDTQRMTQLLNGMSNRRLGSQDAISSHRKVAMQYVNTTQLAFSKQVRGPSSRSKLGTPSFGSCPHLHVDVVLTRQQLANNVATATLDATSSSHVAFVDDATSGAPTATISSSRPWNGNLIQRRHMNRRPVRSASVRLYILLGMGKQSLTLDWE